MIPDRHRPQLIQHAQDVVQQVCQHQLGSMRRLPRIEIDFVASLVENGAGLLETEWQKTLNGEKIDVRVAGVFCHQSPMIDIQGTPPYTVPTRRCELADLLVLHSHSRSDGKVFWRGVLMQTKVHSGQTVTPDEPQLWLYRDWPNFVIASPGFDRRLRNFELDQRSGRYALVSNNGWHVLQPANPLVAASPSCLDLGEFLVNMLYDMDPAQPGRASTHGRQVYQNSTRDWSPTIWDLLRYTAKNSLRHKGKKRGLYHHDLSRLGGGVLQFMVHEAVQGSAPPGGTEDYRREDGEEGFGILIIETRQPDRLD